MCPRRKNRHHDGRRADARLDGVALSPSCVDAHDFSRPSISTFVVRIWLEDPPTSGMGPTWRATITDVVGERQRTVDRLDLLVDFIVTRLVAMGVPPDSLKR